MQALRRPRAEAQGSFKELFICFKQNKQVKMPPAALLGQGHGETANLGGSMLGDGVEDEGTLLPSSRPFRGRFSSARDVPDSAR